MVTRKKIAIIGGGPAGLSAALYSARAGLAPVVFAGSPPGGQLMLTTEVENFPGINGIMGPSLIEGLRAQVNQFGTEIRDENIIKVDFKGNDKILSTSKEEYAFQAVIIATGAQALWLGLESEERLRGRGVSACATCDGFFFKNKTVAVVGGGDTALEEAQTLTKFANKVYVIHRRDQFRASKIMQERIVSNPKIELLFNNEIVEVLGENKVEGIAIKKAVNGSTSISLDGLFVAIGHKPDTALFKDHILLDEKGYILTTASYALKLFQSETLNENTELRFAKLFQSATTSEGVFAAGDCVDHVYRQASTAAGMGVGASLDAERWLEQS